MGLAILKSKVPGPQHPWDECKNTCISRWFDVEEGCQAEVRVVKFPPGKCMCIQQYHYTCCCKHVEHLPVLDDCGCQICSNQPGSYCIGPGRYHLYMFDSETGEPYNPDPSEILVSVHHKIC